MGNAAIWGQRVYAGWRRDGLIVLLAVIWGSTYPLLHAVTQHYPPLSLIALRFGCAVLGMTLIVRWQESRAPRATTNALGRKGWRVALILGGTLYIAFATHTIGLQRTTVARGSLFTGLSVVFVPILARLLLRQRIMPGALRGLALTLGGLILLSATSPFGGNGAQFYTGDPLVVVCAVAFALHIVLVTALAHDLPPVALNHAQMVVVAALAIPTALLHDGIARPPAIVWLAATFLGLIATALCYALQLVVQRNTTPSHIAVLLGLKPIVAIALAAGMGEPLSTTTICGGSLLLLSVITAAAPERKSISDGAAISGKGTDGSGSQHHALAL